MFAQDQERRRIARELHDSAGQNLAALGMSLGRIEDDAKRDPAQPAKSIKDARDLIQELTREIRTTSYLLHPPLLDEMGLSSALRSYIDGLAERSGLSIELNIPDNLERLAPEIELAISRLVQESLTNIHRHSGSKTAVIRIVRDPDKVYAEVQDHGKGISQERLAEIQFQGVGVGIRGMRERVRQCHGELTVDSTAPMVHGFCGDNLAGAQFSVVSCEAKLLNQTFGEVGVALCTLSMARPLLRAVLN